MREDYYTPQPFAIRFLKDRLPLLIEGNVSHRRCDVKAVRTINLSP